MSELEKVMIYKTGRTLTDGCEHCGKSRTYCDGLQDRRDGEACCLSCENAEQDPH